jgi:transposase
MISRPHKWQPMYLPYSLELNQMESVWLTMKARWLNNPVFKNEEKLLERLHKAILNVTANLAMSRQTNAIRTLYWQTL